MVPKNLDRRVHGAAFSNRAEIDAHVGPSEMHSAGCRIKMEMPPPDRGFRILADRVAGPAPAPSAKPHARMRGPMLMSNAPSVAR